MGASFRYSLESIRFLRGYSLLCARKPNHWHERPGVFYTAHGRFNLKEATFGLLILLSTDNTMSRPNILQVRLSDEELEKLKRYAQQKQISAAEVVR